MREGSGTEVDIHLGRAIPQEARAVKIAFDNGRLLFLEPMLAYWLPLVTIISEKGRKSQGLYGKTFDT